MQKALFVLLAVMLGAILAKEDAIIPVDIDAMNLDEPTTDDSNEDDRTFALLYTSCASTKNCTNSNYYCGYALLAGYRCFPKKCFGICLSASQCSTGVCTLGFCQSCIGK